MADIFYLNDSDNVAVATSDLSLDDQVDSFSIQSSSVPRGHKVATKAIPKGENVLKYGQIIGQATSDIHPGEHVHTHNLSMSAHTQDYGFSSQTTATDYYPIEQRDEFMGYKREDGKVGTRNYVGIISSVNCSATVAHQVVRQIEDSGVLKQFPNVDGVVAITHGVGCCISSQNEAFRMLQRTIWGHVRHPNFGGILMVGLGCETNQIPGMVATFGKPPAGSLHFNTIQGSGGTRKTIAACVKQLIEEVLPAANKSERETCCVSELIVALQCGGSDGLSGITANPALGIAVDKLVRMGGSAILAETTEVYGAEHLLTRRSVSEQVGQKLVDRIHWWEDYAAKLDGEINNNPTPGNKAGGLTTILEKSLGAICKAGSTNLTDVLLYSEPIKTKGLVHMDSPGYDPMGLTGEVSSGGNLIAFTTGRGSAYGNKPVPSIKIATNTTMFNLMEEDMDINAGTIAEGQQSHSEVAEQIYQSFLSTASGSPTKSESLGYGNCEFVPWNISAQM